MHREIMKVVEPKIQIDHINHNTLDNRKENLRICTNIENSRNRRKRKDSCSKYKGVCYIGNNKWKAYIGIVVGKDTHIGCFTTEEDAARAYNKVANEHFGEFALLNDVDEWEDFSVEDVKIKRKDKTSKYRGVIKKKNKYEATIYSGRQTYTGLYYDEKVAAVYYNIKAIEL